MTFFSYCKFCVLSDNCIYKNISEVDYCKNDERGMKGLCWSFLDSRLPLEKRVRMKWNKSTMEYE